MHRPSSRTRSRARSSALSSFVSLALVLSAATACGGGDEPSTAGGEGSGGDDLELVYITNGVDPFWTIAAAGVKDAAEEFGVDCDVRMPEDGTSATQKQMLEDALTLGKDGIAISPVDGDNMASLVDQAAALTNVITHDSDAPSSQRLCYVGTDNYAAGRECGKFVKEAMPDGGSLIIFIGRLEQDNARLRRQGVIDEVLGRSYDPSRFDPVSETVEGNGYTILDTRTDNFDKPRAKANAEDALARYPDLGCMVGLFAYNPPACLEALRVANRLGEVAVVAFDEADETLQGIADGTVVGTITQQPYEYGWHSVRILTALAKGDRSVLPEGGVLDVPIVPVTPENVEEFRVKKAELLERGR